MNRKFAIAYVIFLMPIFMLAHGDKLPFSFSGIVSEEGGQGLEGVTISIEHNGQVLQSTKSDAEGNFKIDMEGPFSRPDQIRVKIQKKGYRSEVVVPINCNSVIDTELERIPTPIPIMRTLPGNTLLI